MTNRTRTLALFVGLAMVLGYSANAGAFVIETCPPVVGCPVVGAQSQGWDGPGLGSFNLGYYIGNPFRANDQGLPAGLTVAQIEAQLLAAMATWSSVVQVSFTKLGDVSLGALGSFQNNSSDFYFHNGVDGAPDLLPFDGAWNPGTNAGLVLAHAWGPPDVMPEITAGNMHFDIAETWVTTGTVILANSASIDLQSILLHELGHVLGLDHENSMGQGLNAPVMQSLHFGTMRSLHPDDIAGIRSLYACAGANCPGIGGVPEPATLLLLGSGLVAWRMSRRRART